MSTRAIPAQLPEHALTAELAMWVFLATEMLFFGVLFAAYLVTRLHHPEAFAAASRLTDLRLGGINTAVLLTSSLTMALAAWTSREQRWRPCVGWLSATGALGVVFLVLKGMEYYSDFERHLVPGASFALPGPDRPGLEQFFFLYFTTTGAHAIHLLIAIGLVVVLAVRAHRRHDHLPSRVVEAGGLYWHLVDIVWIFLFPLLYLVSRA